MGFFNKPGKAFKAFCNDPIGKLHNDLNNMTTPPPQQTSAQKQCRSDCFDLHHGGPPNANFSDKNYGLKDGLNVIGYYNCVKGCNVPK